MTLLLAAALAIGLSWSPAHSGERLAPRAVLSAHGAETSKALYPPPKALYPLPSPVAPPVEVIRGESITQHYQLPSAGGSSVEVIRGEVKSQVNPPPASGAPQVEVIMGEKKTKI